MQRNLPTTPKMKFIVKKGRPVWPKMAEPQSAESRSYSEAMGMIEALVDAAHEIGIRGIIDDYSQNDFHLYPKHIADLLRSDHPAKAIHSDKGKDSLNRIAVPWPWRLHKEAKSLNELRERPFEIIGLLMRKVLDADAPFFETLAGTLRELKREQAQAAREGNKTSTGKIKAGKISTSIPKIGIEGDPDWFSRIPPSRRKGKAPHEIWKLCKQRHDSRGIPPNRREIRDHLEATNVSCTNLRTVLARMNLDWLPEGPRGGKRNIE